MYYTIASLESPHTGDRLDINKNGNKYIVYAYKVFEKLSSWIIYGYYDFYHRSEYLLTGTMK